MSQNSKTWRLSPGGPLLGTQMIMSPWTGGPTEAVVNLDNNMVIAAHGATCQPFPLLMPDSIFKGELRSQMPEIAAPVMSLPAPASSISGSVGTTDDCIEPAPYALTEEHLPVLERWIRSRGHKPVFNTDTGKVVIVCTGCEAEDCKCVLPF